MTEENPLEQEESKRTPAESSRLMKSLSSLGGQVIEGAQKAVGIAGQGAKTVAKAAGSGIRSGAQAVKAQVKEVQEKRAATSGLKQDYSILGKTKRYWVDSGHYVVFDPNDTAERDMAQQAVEDFRLYGKVEGEQGDHNEVIEAGEAELSSKKLNKDPLISPETSRKIAAGGHFLAHGMAKPKKKRPAYLEIDLDEDDTIDLDVGEDEDEDEDEDEERSHRKLVRVPRKKTRDVVFKAGSYNPVNMEDLVPKIFPDKKSYGTGEYTVPSITNVLPRIKSAASGKPRRTGPIEFRSPSIENVLPKIRSGNLDKPRRTGPIEFRSPSIENVLPKIRSGNLDKPRRSGPIEFRQPSIESVLPKIHLGQSRPRSTNNPVMVRPNAYQPPKIGDILPNFGASKPRAEVTQNVAPIVDKKPRSKKPKAPKPVSKKKAPVQKTQIKKSPTKKSPIKKRPKKPHK